MSMFAKVLWTFFWWMICVIAIHVNSWHAIGRFFAPRCRKS